jgi:hypothetical protein
MRRPAGTTTVNLTRRGRLALEFAAEGYTAEGVAFKMSRALRVHVSTPQAQNTLQYARAALGARNTTHAVAIALREGYIL